MKSHREDFIDRELSIQRLLTSDT